MFTERWRESKNANKTDPAQLLIDYKETFNTEAGKRVLHDLERKTTFGRPAVSGVGPIDEKRLIYSEAQRAFFLYILKKLYGIPEKKERKVKNEQYDRP